VDPDWEPEHVTDWYIGGGNLSESEVVLRHAVRLREVRPTPRSDRLEIKTEVGMRT
jgi:hypothetical protein